MKAEQVFYNWRKIYNLQLLLSVVFTYIYLNNVMNNFFRNIIVCFFLLSEWSCKEDSNKMDWMQHPMEIQRFTNKEIPISEDSIFNSQGVYMPTGVPFSPLVEERDWRGLEFPINEVTKGERSPNEFDDKGEYPAKWESLPVDRGKMRTIRMGQGNQKIPLTNSTGGQVITGQWISILPKKIEIKSTNNLDTRVRQLGEDHQLTNISTETGFEVNYVWSMQQDHQGQIWMGTRGSGLLKLDGNKFTQWDRKLGLPNNVIRSVEIDQSGRVWIGTWGQGLCMKEGDQWYQYSEAEGLSCNLITKIFIDSKQRVWFGTEYGGVGVLDQGKLMQFSSKEGLLENTILDIEESNNGEIFFATYGAYLISWDGKQFFYWDESVGIEEKLVWSLHRDRQGSILIGTWGEKLYKWDGNAMHQLKITGPTKLGPVMSIQEDKYGGLWMGIYGKGVANLLKNKLSFIDATDGLSNEKVLDVMIDRLGRVWASTAGGGIQVLTNTSLERQKLDDYVGTNAINTLVVTKDNDIWMGANGAGMIKIKDKKYVDLNPSWDVGSAFYDLLEDRQGNIWVATDGKGLFKRSQASSIHYNVKTGLCSNVVTAVFQDSKNRIWMAFDNNKVAYIDQRKLMVIDEYSAETRSAIRTFTEDRDGVIYWGVNDMGIVKCIFNENKPVLEILSNQQGLPYRSYFDMEFWNGNIWLATEAGIIQWRNSQVSMIKSYLGKPIGQAFALMPWKERMMVCTERGLVAIKRREELIDSIRLDRPLEDYMIERSDRLEYENIAFNRDAKLAVDKMNKLIFVNGQEIIFITEELWKRNFAIFSPVVSSFFVNGAIDNSYFSDFNASNGVLDNLGLVKHLEHNQNNVSIVFSNGAESILANEYFTYRLKGIQEEWSIPSTNRKIDFLGLTSGKYDIQIATVSANGTISSSASFSFLIHPPWWFSSFAKMIYLFLIVCGIWMLIRWRTQRLKRSQILLEREIEKATQEIVQQKIYADEQREKIAESQKLILESIEYAKRIQTAILPPQKLVRSYLPESFIIYQPKDIVAGDFYWMETLRYKNDDWIAFAAADCTGHGVPGALMSVLCHNGLNRSVKENGLFYPNEILNKTREIVINELGDDDNVINDGMDISLCVLKQNILYWSGANNPLWIIRNQEVIEYKGDKQPVGRFHQPFPFSLTEIVLEKNDLIFIATDGFVDQFGGPYGKKFKSLALKQLLIENYRKDIQEIRQVLMRSFEIWKGNTEQVDDVCLIGLKY